MKVAGKMVLGAGGLETNFYWVAGTLAAPTLNVFFYPYYFLAVFSIFAHVAAAIHFNAAKTINWIPKLLLVLGAIVAIVIVLAFGGSLFEIELPSEYLNYYQISAV